jgi:hypothetical protein
MKHRPGGICNINEIVSHMVLVSINNEGHFGSVICYKHCRLIQYIDVVVPMDTIYAP